MEKSEIFAYLYILTKNYQQNKNIFSQSKLRKKIKRERPARPWKLFKACEIR